MIPECVGAQVSDSTRYSAYGLHSRRDSCGGGEIFSVPFRAGARRFRKSFSRTRHLALFLGGRGGKTRSSLSARIASSASYPASAMWGSIFFFIDDPPLRLGRLRSI